jgi:D-amino-acid dehydrogenase
MKGLQWLFKADAPLSMNLRPSWHKYSWLAEFASNIGKYEKHTIATAKLAINSREIMRKFSEQAGLSFDRVDRGILHFYKSEADFAHAHRVTKLLSKAGLLRRQLTANEVYEIEPALRAPVIGGYYTESDFTGDIHKFATGLAEAARKQGVSFVLNAEVKDIKHRQNQPHISWKTAAGEIEDDLFNGVVVTAGVMSRKLAGKLGDRVNIYPVKGYSITLDLKDASSQAAAPTVSLLDDAAKIVTARLGADRFRVAGTAEINGINYDIPSDRIAPLTRWVEANFPKISTEHVVPWTGLRPMMPSMMPHIGPGQKPGVYYNTGHGHLGWTLSCISAQLISDIIHSQDIQRLAG